MAGAEASTISGLFRDKINEVLERLANFAGFGTNASISATGGMSNAGTALGQLAAARGAAIAQGIGGISGALGTYFGMKG